MRKYQDGHHVIFNRQEWNLRPEAQAIREHPSLIPRLDRAVHEELHRECPPVPLLGFYALKRTLKEWYPQRDTLESMDSLLFAMDLAAQSEKAHLIESELVRLAMQAVELQKPFIKEGQL